MRFGITMIVVIIVIFAFSYVWEVKHFRKNLRIRLREEYGKKPDMGDCIPDYKETAIYYNLIRERIPEDEQVDEITWEDLEMDRIFSRMNNTISFAGEQLLYAWLHCLSEDRDILERRRRKICYFDEHPKEREEVQFFLCNLRKEPVNYYIPEYIGQLEFEGIPFIFLCKFLLCSLLVLVLCAALSGSVQMGMLAGINFLVNLALYAFSKTKYEVQMEALYGIIRVVKAANIIFPFCQESLDSDEKQKAAESMDKLKGIAKMVLLLEQKKQARLSGDMIALMGDYLLGAFMWDFLLYDRVIRLLLKKSESFLVLYQFAGEMDACIAATSFRRSLGCFCEPEFCEGSMLQAEEIYHPLLDQPVTNDFKMDKNVIITGSNASGKSTFIKAVAVNLILGQSIYTCTARRMTMPGTAVLTSMAVRDDVLSGESYYIREIRYLKRMIARSEGERLIFCGIDEILRGTNTMERIAASISVLKYLNERNCILMTATHDLELAEEFKGIFENYYFCESVEGNDVSFDYKLHKGISYTRNAVRLLHAMGFPEEIVSAAQEGCRKG